jgi:hypothetical protein
VYLEQYKKLRGNVKVITLKLTKFCDELFNKSFPINFDGLDIMKTLEHVAKKYNIKFIIYNIQNFRRIFQEKSRPVS